MHVALLDGASEGLAPDEKEDRENRERHARDRLPAQDVDPVDRRVPVGGGRHEKVDRDDRDQKAVDGESRRRKELHPPLEALAVRRVLPLRETAQGDGEQRPRGEADGEPDRDESRIHVRGPVAEELVGGDARGVRPGVDVLQAEEKRHGEEGDEREGSRRRLEDAADHEAPSAARHVVEHLDRERAERHAEDEAEGDEVRAIELRGIDEQPRGRDRREDDADGERAAADGREVRGGRRPVGRPERFRAGFCHRASLLSDFLEGEWGSGVTGASPEAGCAAASPPAARASSFCSSSFSRNSLGMFCDA